MSITCLLFLPLVLAVGSPARGVFQDAEDSQTLPGVFPWLASVLIDSAFYCEGYLITNKHVLITANCVVGGTYFDILLGGGDTELSTGIVWVHPGYNETSLLTTLLC
eukprot:TRINITY_DN8913_c0_g1_i1.p1 TRINITY_DN8913_c0_g1~~TRINITY_DN8913_c0_g1_i1.p1  ORF type:complete len:107 (+),score=23.27 TRINITY_DN8913_c0_g1_i1:74-394(+)